MYFRILNPVLILLNKCLCLLNLLGSLVEQQRVELSQILLESPPEARQFKLTL